MKISIKPTIKQYEAWKALKTHNKIFLGGGAGGGKSWFLCETRLINCYLYPGYKSFIGREELKRLMASTYLTWCKVCSHHKIPQSDWKLNGQYNFIEFKNGSRVDLLDLKYLPSDPLYERFGSLEYTDGAIEESGEIHFLAYDVLKTRIGRHRNTELGVLPTITMTGNPKKNWTYNLFYKPWSIGELPSDTAFIQSLYNDNPYTAESYGKQLSDITDIATKERLMYGNWDYDDDPSALVEYDALLDMFTNTHVQHGKKTISADLAMQGRDKFVAGFWDGLRCTVAIDMKKSTGKEIENELTRLKNTRGVSNTSIVADSDGLGAYLNSYIKNIVTFHGGGTAIHNKEFGNIKDECGFKLAEKINNREIYIICTKAQEEEIKKELSVCLKRDNIDTDKKKIINKAKMKEYLGHSPDYLDMLLMGMYFQIKSKQFISYG